jgi:hypothetical protein
MIIRFDARTRGEHAHVRVWAGSGREHLALCGRLCFRVPEWEFLRQLLCGCPGTSRIPLGSGESVEISK